MSQPLVVVSLSGGMDSTALLATYLRDNYRVVTLSVDYGQRHHRELDAAQQVVDYYRDTGHDIEHVVWESGLNTLLGGSALTSEDVAVPDGHYAWDIMRVTVVANRNAIFANAAAGLAVSRNAAVVGLGMHSGDHAQYPDCRPVAVAAINTCVQVCNEGFNPPKVEARFMNINKTEIARIGAVLDAPLHLSWSCYNGGEVHCGTCSTCYERREAFRDAKLPDPTNYLDSVTEFSVVTP